MVAFPTVQKANLLARSTLPGGLVAVFAGATAGIGEAALKAFTKHTLQPKIYFIGRSQDAGDRILRELKVLNPEGTYLFVKADMSLLKNVDDVCTDIKKKENAINVLFMSQGTLRFGVDTAEGLPLITAVSLYSRTRLTINLLDHLRKASSVRRVVTVMAGTKEGPIFADDIPGRNVPLRGARGHLCTTLTLSLDALSRKAPEVSFIHNFPGAVDTNLIRRGDGMILLAVKYWSRLSFAVTRSFLPAEECGERQAWLCLSGRYPSKEAGDGARGVASEMVAIGADGKSGSGVYSVDWDGESAPDSIVQLLDKYRAEGMVDTVWNHLEDEFKRITGSTSD
ncbi:hypothetical protein B0J13DRAFT_627912 [Dactylonectria estremocensis]|uniref:Ketoreductase (KR) domain-containing protein n=1 Tax=Dactylonectria estremocensis TaxID=1079267 RepID=A0A9P9IP97_9HYPO|nr:hypothetical protein B0J13DRAFT_627912 [Dactylonectria estremocensis]